MVDLAAILDSVYDVDWTPIVLAIVLGGMIGIEREIHGRPAGFRTHILVCLSTTLLIRTSQLLPAAVPHGATDVTTVFDPSRLGAGVVTGIGFLGAAAVIRSGDIVRGITTGACVWAVAVLGVVIGSGGYGLAIVGATVMLGVLVLFDRALAWTSPVVYRRLRVTSEGPELHDLHERIEPLLRERGISVQDLSGRSGDGPAELILHVRCRSALQAPELIERVRDVEGVRAAQWSMLSSD
jgi:putative Mg2+ transporter-C (MgtC) family protein